MTLAKNSNTGWDSDNDDLREALTTLHTNGTDTWSSAVKAVKITELTVPAHYPLGDEFGELRVHFNTESWRPDIDGIIYTDKLFIKELKDYLTFIGLKGDEVDYSEQGMQGDNYVSCDVNSGFLASWTSLNQISRA